MLLFELVLKELCSGLMNNDLTLCTKSSLYWASWTTFNSQITIHPRLHCAFRHYLSLRPPQQAAPHPTSQAAVLPLAQALGGQTASLWGQCLAAFPKSCKISAEAQHCPWLRITVLVLCTVLFREQIPLYFLLAGMNPYFAVKNHFGHHLLWETTLSHTHTHTHHVKRSRSGSPPLHAHPATCMLFWQHLCYSIIIVSLLHWVIHPSTH